MEVAFPVVCSYLPAFGFQTFHAHNIVDGSLVRIIENVVGFLHLNEQIHRELFVSRIRVFIRVVEQSQPTVGLLNGCSIRLEYTTNGGLLLLASIVFIRLCWCAMLRRDLVRYRGDRDHRERSLRKNHQHTHHRRTPYRSRRSFFRWLKLMQELYRR